MKKQSTPSKQPRTAFGKSVARGLKRAAAAARVTATRYKTRIHVIDGGHLVSLDPAAKLPASIPSNLKKDW